VPCIFVGYILSLYSGIGAVVQNVVIWLLLTAIGTCARYRPVPTMQVEICGKAPNGKWEGEV